MDIKEINPRVNINHWYYQTKYTAAQKMLNDAGVWPSKSEKKHIIVDVGAGSAIFTKAFFKSLKAHEKSAYAVDINYWNSFLGIRGGIHFVKALPQEILPTHLFFMDILEHIENDVDFLKNWVGLSPKSSLFLITVPAFEFLWSSHDVFLDHKRRYNLERIEKVAIESGLVTLKSRYLYAIILPLVFIIRKIFEPLIQRLDINRPQGIRPANPLINTLLKIVLSIEVSIFPSNRLFGFSCMILAKKP